ncbi:MAG: glycosyltransferase family 2 protein [Coriobacteriales bacterium]|nr:glycosyltransferase family 2 protein [Coriobacteriales bacterium]
MSPVITLILGIGGVFFLLYLLFYASYLFLSVAMGAWRLYQQDKMRSINNELRHDYYFPISILVPAYNEEVTIVEGIESLLKLDYRLFEIVVVDDGSKDQTSQVLIDHFHMHETSEPIRLTLATQPIEAIYKAPNTRVNVTLIRKKNGGKSDALNVGINASKFPYFICMDADSMLQSDSLERIVQPAMEEDNVVAVGGLVRISQCIDLEEEHGVYRYHLPWNMLVGMQVLEYDRSFLASRILLDSFNGNLIVSGAFGLFRKDVVVAAGGYATDTVGEDMELIMKLHTYCRNNMERYSIRYEPNAVCWSQAPFSMKDLMKQRMRWHTGLMECMTRYSFIFGKQRYGFMGTVSYLYYLLYELWSPVIELFGMLITLLALWAGLLSLHFAVRFYLLFALYGAILTITAFFQRIYTQKLTVSRTDVLRACFMCVVENVFFRFVMDYVRLIAMLKYRRGKSTWGRIERKKHNERA